MTMLDSQIGKRWNQLKPQIKSDSDTKYSLYDLASICWDLGVAKLRINRFFFRIELVTFKGHLNECSYWMLLVMIWKCFLLKPYRSTMINPSSNSLPDGSGWLEWAEVQTLHVEWNRVELPMEDSCKNSIKDAHHWSEIDEAESWAW